MKLFGQVGRGRQQRQLPARRGGSVVRVGILLSVEFSLGAVLDLTEPTTQATLDTNDHELCSAWRPLNARGSQSPTQKLGATIYAMCQIEALKAPSAREQSAFNLVVYPDRLLATSSVRVYDDSGLIDARLP